MKKIGICIALCALMSVKINAQTQIDTREIGGITTALPFLLIIPDARAGGMGDMGVATSADAFSLFHNPAKMSFSDRQVKAAITYSPWLRNLTDDIFTGITAPAGGFYGPQGRVLRLALQDSELNNKIDSFNFNGNTITNLEMETSAIYGLAKLLGHNAVSMNAIIANRANGTFSENPGKIVADLIKYTLDKLVE